jgi:dihydrofolate synthase/folylpolyglutamate synthase
VARIRPAVAALARAGHATPSFFEVTIAIAFGLFAGRVDHGVVGTGVGGLLDSTNTISRPDEFAVITAIGMDHVDRLGPTLPEIARQKAGILPVGGCAVAARSPSPEVKGVLCDEASRRRCVLQLVDLELHSAAAASGSGGTELCLPGGPALPLGLTGRHQAGNAYLALRTVGAIAAREGWQLDPRAIRAGLRSASLPAASNAAPSQVGRSSSTAHTTR